MSNFVKILLIMGTLSFNGVALADWQSDCQSLQNAQNPCAPIQKQSDALAVYMTPVPFVSTTINQFPQGVFPKGSPWGSASSGGGAAGGGGGGALQSSSGTGSGTGDGQSTGAPPSSSGGGASGSWQ